MPSILTFPFTLISQMDQESIKTIPKKRKRKREERGFLISSPLLPRFDALPFCCSTSITTASQPHCHHSSNIVIAKKPPPHRPPLLFCCCDCCFAVAPVAGLLLAAIAIVLANYCHCNTIFSHQSLVSKIIHHQQLSLLQISYQTLMIMAIRGEKHSLDLILSLSF